LRISSWLHPYLNLQKVVAANALVVHLVVGIVGVTAALVLNEGEAVVIVNIQCCSWSSLKM
jgi:hypothetical protein